VVLVEAEPAETGNAGVMEKQPKRHLKENRLRSISPSILAVTTNRIMKKKLWIAVLCFPMAAMAQDDFTVTGQIGTRPDKIFLSYRTASGFVLDSTEVSSNGTFKFHGRVDAPSRALVTSPPDTGTRSVAQIPDRLEIYLEKGAIRITSKDSLTNAMVKGGKANKDFSAYRELSAGPNAKINAMMIKFAAASEDQRRDPQFQTDLQAMIMEIEAEQKAIDLEFITANPKSLLSLDLLASHMDTESAEEVIEPAFRRLSKRLRQSEKGRMIGEMLETTKRVDIGAIAPEFAQPDTAGNEISLSSFRGKYVLVDFWASWCAPCRHENPNVVAAYQRFRDKNFTVLGVSLDRPGAKDAWLKAIHADGLQEWAHVSELKWWNSEVVQQYAIKGIPANFLLDPEGRIIGKNLRGEVLHATLEELLR